MSLKTDKNLKHACLKCHIFCLLLKVFVEDKSSISFGGTFHTVGAETINERPPVDF